MGKQILPLLESWGATKAIPLSTQPSQSTPLLSQPSQSTPLPTQPPQSTSLSAQPPQPTTTTPSAAASNPVPSQSNDMDTTCIEVWRSLRVVEAMGDLRQRSYSNTEDAQTLAKLALFLYEKTFHNEVTFLGLQRVCEQLTLHGSDPAWESPLFELLVVLTPQLALASSSVTRYGQQSEKLFSSLATQLTQLATEAGEDVKTAATVALAALCSSPVMTEMLQRAQMLSTMLSKLSLRDLKENGAENPDGVVAKAALLANVCRGVQVSCEGCDASEECIAVMNALSSGMLEETCEEVLELRICGVYLLVKRGGITEHLMAEAQGVGKDNHPAIDKCTDKWNQLVNCVAEYSFVCSHVTWFSNRVGSHPKAVEGD